MASTLAFWPATRRFDVELLDAIDRELDRAEDEISADLACLTRAKHDRLRDSVRLCAGRGRD